MINQCAKRMDDISPFYVMAILERAKQLEETGCDVIHMEIGEPDFPTPDTISNSILPIIASGQIKYTPAAGLTELRKQIVGFYGQHYGVMVKQEQIFVTPGASGAFLLALGCSLNPDHKILMADPCYPCNSNFVRLFGGQAFTIPVDAATDFQLSAALIQKNWSSTCAGVLVASPSNPTGTLIPEDELGKMIQVVRQQNGAFYSDEIYHGLVYGKNANTALQFGQDVFVINSFSKFFGMTGWRIGWLVVPEAYIEATERLAQNIFIATGTLSQLAALAAFDPSTLAELESRRREFERRRDFLYDNLLRLGFMITAKPEGAFYIYADCSRFTRDSNQFAQDLLEEEYVALTPGKDFGKHNAHKYIRLAYTTSIERMAEAIARIERFINRHPSWQ
ncbi:MAG: pyridoxal phosphate-dependent aminotransferase [Methylicorpusculum sp.]|uniref:pyridoxal phosphate-dependent aminotransferase n=2 Tax=Methylicorpusculum sp. TaxID=2713644 RepID=UPI00272355E3|nr:pyridoxal phosphate-dependent aminotransferase [Methylicorpusculum sp.]MDO8844816.1 pyridoxal phosphate-dependent aminotransferase [Methylicorpusculum sp.]MDO8938013.1 pyridoxal phosphate-dependent aminotransferase [Methylicorpusculum sp.]MDP2177677.1 pyridoxal phosphate-dependent aminotransferase [Methylicorpusculum sp.]MDP2201595.1 pyridoxal phosphate-dependent aminotransferase [Methylicorpusculum sp.]MDP3528621.1 pyridoxal phosphate-dependent aminotransferase [Methylicorpusculum sp.]